MTRLQMKLHSKRGASMLLALLFLFFCLTVGAVVLTAATASAGRTARVRIEQQEYLAVQSAARLLRDDLLTLKYTGRHTETTVQTTLVGVDGFPDTDITHWFDLLTSTPAGKLARLLDADYKSLYWDGDTPGPSQTREPEKHTLTLTPENASQIPEVIAELKLQDNYAILVVLYLPKEDGSRSNVMTLSLTPRTETISNSETTFEDGKAASIITTVTTSEKRVDYISSEITKGLKKETIK